MVFARTLLNLQLPGCGDPWGAPPFLLLVRNSGLEGPLVTPEPVLVPRAWFLGPAAALGHGPSLLVSPGDIMAVTSLQPLEGAFCRPLQVPTTLQRTTPHNPVVGTGAWAGNALPQALVPVPL